MQTPKVLVVDLSIRYGGTTSRILSILKQSPSDKIGIAVLDPSAVKNEAEKLNIPVYVVGSNRRDINIPKNLSRVINEEKFEVVDTQNIQSKFWASFAVQHTDVAFVSTINSWYASSELGRFSLKGKLYTQLELATNANLDLYITVSESDRQCLLRSNIPDEKIALIYNSVQSQLSLIKSQREWLVNKFNLPHTHKICTCVGRLVKVKGHDIFIEAVKKISETDSETHFLIVGEGDFRKYLELKIQDLHLEKRITLVGHQDRDTVYAILKSSDIFVMPSRYEGTPIALLEAAALGIPIVSTHVGGIPELVTNDVHAILVTPNRHDELATAIQKLLKDNEFAEKISRNAKERVHQKFGLEHQLDLTWQAYQKAVYFHQKKQSRV